MMLAAILLAAAAPDPVAGTWEGTSLCQVKPSPCHDEHVIYRISRTGAGQYRLDGYKVVNRKELFMGSIDFTFDASRQQLHADIVGARGSSTADLKLSAKHLSGNMTLTDGTLFRLIEVDKR
ncbi:MAG: hypothetical protein JO335_03625 [Sphingomonas sp.]|nr:hypothetical protein [Sphingomonas sp.]